MKGFMRSLLCIGLSGGLATLSYIAFETLNVFSAWWMAGCSICTLVSVIYYLVIRERDE